jgi:hypothetical protein
MILCQNHQVVAEKRWSNDSMNLVQRIFSGKQDLGRRTIKTVDEI